MRATRVQPEIGYIELTGFAPDVEREFEAALGSLRGTRGLILDLRQNGGGFVNTVVRLASHFLPPGTSLGAFVSRQGKRKQRRTERVREVYREPVIAQRYIPEIRKGDKRIILVDGKAAGAVSRMPQEGEARANFHAGGAARHAELTARERMICEAIGPALSERGLIFVGIDVIGDYLTEINVTSPTGILEINRLSGTKIEADIWDAIEQRRGRK